MKILKFETATCTPCKMIDMMLKDKGLEVDEKIDIVINEDLREQYDVMKAPTLMLIDENGVEIDRVIGIDEDKIINLFKQAGRI